jgi:hypothetical protein
MKQNMFKSAWVALLLVLLIALLVTPAAAQDPAGEEDVNTQAATFTAVFWNPATMPVPLLGATAINRVFINGANQVYGFTLEIGYDANRLTPGLANIQPGSLLPGTRGVDYFFQASLMTTAPACAAGATPAGIRITVAYVGLAGPIQGSGALVDIPWTAHNGGPATPVCINPGTSRVVDQLGLGTPLPLIVTPITVVAPSTQFRIGLQGGKNAGLPVPPLLANHATSVTVNGLPRPVAFPGATADTDAAVPPYNIEVRRLGYLDVSASFDTPAALKTIYMVGGDVNDDDQINILDLALLAALLGQPAPVAGPLEHYDFTGPGLVPNGVIDITDLVILARNFGQSGPTDGTPPPGTDI